ncbi:MAG TPA: DUF2065 domain-containing protein [Deltaproteobacteria bacterium]|nr:DUF2065 domain-containing protein [Deltaproteobacteria bacterium]
MKFFLCVLGLVFVIEGLPYFAFPNKMKSYLMAVYQAPNKTLRVFGFFSVVIGLLLVFFGRN